MTGHTALVPHRRPLAPPGPGIAADAYACLVFAYPAALASIRTIFELDAPTFVVLLLLGTTLLGMGPLLATPRETSRIATPPVGIALLLFIAVSTISNLIAIKAEVRYDGLALWRQFLMAMLPLALYWGTRVWSWHGFAVRAVDRGVAALLAVSAASVLLEHFRILTFEGYGSRSFGFLGDDVAWLLSLPAVYFLVRGRLVPFGLAIGALLLTQSRGALVVVAGGIALNVALSRAITVRAMLMRLFVLVAGLLGALFAQDLFQSYFQRFSNTDLGDNDRVRTTMFTLGVFMQRPAIGSGYNAHGYFFAPLAGGTAAGAEIWGTPVSTFAQVLADAGVAGFVPFAAAMLLICCAGVRAVRLRSASAEVAALAGLGAWVAAFIPTNQSATWLTPSSLLDPLVAVAAGIVVGAEARLRNANRRPAQSPAPPYPDADARA